MDTAEGVESESCATPSKLLKNYRGQLKKRLESNIKKKKIPEPQLTKITI